MTASPFTLILTPENDPDRFLLTGGVITYPIELRPDINMALSDLLHNLHQEYNSERTFATSSLLREIGAKLWQVLMPDTVPIESRAALAHELRSSASHLRIAVPPSLATLPWELLYDIQSPNGEGFLGLRRPIVRLIPGGTNLPLLFPPLRVLLLISSPPGLEERQRIDVESARAAVESAVRPLREAGLLYLQVEDIVTPRRVQQALLRFNPHILHYIGHGVYEEGHGGFLLWEDEQTNPLPISGVRLADLLRSRKLRAVLLHSCKSSGNYPLNDISGLGRVLTDARLPAVLAQEYDFMYESSQRLNEMLYIGLCSGLGLAEATFETRLALSQTDHPLWALITLQATVGGLSPLLDAAVQPGPPDSALARGGAAADIPAPTGVFVGRQRELRALRAMLDNASSREPVLALITGPGGVGKTTLAAQAIVRYGGRYKATLMLSCISYQGIDLFLQRIGGFLKSWEEPKLLEIILPDPRLPTSTKIQAAIEELNNAGPFLLLIDSLESAQREDLKVVDTDLLLLLQSLQTDLHNGRVLVISRYHVNGLLVDKEPGILRLALGDLSDYEVRQLLIRHPLSTYLDDNTRNELIREFGGLPYVYDLLSSNASKQNLAMLIHETQGRISNESKRYIHTEWDQVRQRVVNFAALESTVAQLTEKAQILLAQLSIFRRPFTAEALEQGLGVTRSDWQSLIDWGLLFYNPVDGTYQLHKLTALYAERLLDIPDRKDTQTRIAEWYFHYANEKSHDLADYLEAQHLFSDAGEAQRAGEIANSLGERLRQSGLYQLWQNLCIATARDTQGSIAAEAQRQLGIIAQDQGQYQQAQQLFNEALAAFEQLDDHKGRATILNQLGTIAQRQGQYEEAQRLYGESLIIFERLGDQSGRATTLRWLGTIAQRQGQYEEAQRLYNESLVIFERLGDQSGQAFMLGQLGIIAQRQWQYEEARRLYNKSLAIFEQLGDQESRATTLHQLGTIAQKQEQYEEARHLYSESLAIFAQLGAQSEQARLLGQLGTIAQVQGQYEEARHLYSESLVIFERLGDQSGRAATFHQLGTIAQVQGQYEEAQRLYRESLAIFERLSDQSGRAVTLHQLGNIAYLQELYQEARQLYNESLTIEKQLGDQSGQATTLHQLGTIAQEQGQYEEARRLYGKSLAIYERLGNQSGRAITLHLLGIIAQSQGGYEEAQRLYSESLAIYERLGNQSGRATTLGQLGLLERQQGHIHAALKYTAQALVIFEHLRSPYQDLALRTIGELRDLLGEAIFTALWKESVGEQPLPSLPVVDPRRDILQTLVALIQAPTLTEAQHILEKHPEILSEEADAILEALIETQQDEKVRKLIEQQRKLLANCRQEGIIETFTELQAKLEQHADDDYTTQLNALYRQVVAALLSKDNKSREALATYIDHVTDSDTTLKTVHDFLVLLAAWLRGEDITPRIGALSQEFQDAYYQILSDVIYAEQSSDIADEKVVRGSDIGSNREPLTLAELLQRVHTLMRQGTVAQRQQFAEEITELQAGLPLEEASLGIFLNCLVAELRGETPDTTSLEAPFTLLWQQLQEATGRQYKRDKSVVDKHFILRCAHCGLETKLIISVPEAALARGNKMIQLIRYCEHCNQPNIINIPKSWDISSPTLDNTIDSDSGLPVLRGKVDIN